MAIQHVKTDGFADFTGTVTGFNSQGSTVTIAATDLVRPSDWNSAHKITQVLSGNTAGASTVSGTNIVYQGGSNVTLSATSDTIVFSAASQSVQTQNMVSVLGSTGNVSFANGNGVTFGGNNSTVTASVQTNYAATDVTTGRAGTSTGFTGTNVSASMTHDTSGLALRLSAAAPFSGGISTGGNTAGNTGVVSNQVVFVGGNNVTLSGSTNGGSATVTISGANAGGAQTGISGIIVSNTTYTSGTVSFSNANGISFGSSAGQAITASYTVPTQTNQTIGLYGSSNTTGQSSSSTVDARSISIVGAGVASVGLSGGSFVVSVPSGGGANFSAGISTGGNTSGQTGVTGTRLVLAGGNNVTLSGATDANGGTITISGANAGGAQTGISGIIVSNTTYTSGTVSFSNANGISFGSSAGQAITASYTVPSITSWTVSDAATSATVGRLAFTNANGLTLSLSTSNNGNHTVIGSYTVPTVTSMTVSDAATSGTLARLAFTNLNGVTLSLSTGAAGSHTIVGSHNALTSQSNQAASGSNGSFTFQTLSFSNANGISFGTSAGPALTASYTVPTQTNQTIGLYGSSNTTGQSSSSTVDARSISIVGAGVASVGLSGGSFVVSVPSGGGANFSAGVSTDGNTAGSTGVTGTRLVFVGSNNITLSQSTNANGGTVSFFGPSPTSAGVTNAGNTSGNTGFVTGQFNLQGGNNITLSGSTNGGSMSVTISGANQTNQSLGIYASSGTMGQSSSSTYDARSLSIVGSGAASVGWSNGSFIISAPNAAAGNVTFSAGAASAGLASIVFSNSNGVSFGLNGSTITASAAGGGGGVGVGVSTMGNTAGSTGTVTTGNAYLVGSGVISLSQSTGAAGSNATISILAPATSSLVGTNGVVVSTAGSTISVQPSSQSYWAWPGVLDHATQTLQAFSNTSYVFPVLMDDVQAFNHIRFIQTVSLGSMASVATTANTTFSYNRAGTINLVVYSRGVGANSQSMQSVGSVSHTSAQSIRVQANANGSQWTVTHAFSFPGSSTNQVTSSTSYATTLSNINISTTHLTYISGMKFVPLPFTSTLTDNQYWLAIGMQTAQTTQGTASLSNMSVAHSYWAYTQANNTFAYFGAVNNASVQAQYGIGSYTQAATGTTGSIAFANISSSASHPIPYLSIAKIA